MSNLITEQFEGKNIRLFERDGETWFMAKDIALALGYANPQKAIRDHCKKQQNIGSPNSFTRINTGFQNSNLELDPQTVIISESDVYRLIISSSLPSAQKFADWVFDEVLPSIRKKGSYGNAAIDILNDPAAMRGLLLGYTEKVIALEHKVEEDKPKVKFYDNVVNIEGLYNLQSAARVLGKKPNLFIAELTKKYLFRQNGNLVPYRQYVMNGIFEIKVQVVDDKQRCQTFITAKGLQYFDTTMNDLFNIKKGA